MSLSVAAATVSTMSNSRRTFARSAPYTPGNHGLQGDELRLLRALRREHPHADFVFLSERKAPLSVDGAQKLIERLGEAAKMPFSIHAHMLPATP